MRYLPYIYLVLICTVGMSHVAYARELSEAGSMATKYFYGVGLAIATLPFIVGGMAFMFGAGMWGRTLLINAAIGLVALLGATSIVAAAIRWF